VINASATRLAVAYTDGQLHPDSARAGSVTEIVLYDAANLAPVKTVSLADLGLTKIASTVFSIDGETLYVLGNGAEVDGKTPQKIIGLNAATGAQVSSVDVTKNVDEVTELITPEVLG
jgi:hypothetical protein